MKVSRRNFIKGSLALSAAPALSACNSETDNSPENNNTGPKALVGIFLFSGNDAYNMVMPM
ncbi:twin-arginine translocation signal domain-containing protein [Moritella sp. Urea-trap-13]|uniref:twin-arginine translocation signal domain-containing protein n=1 Tax=Moritella sp. Urea-trap-13 TaxID=2058327 RepID=UPI0018E3D830|nr:twin-arginine translocation signal domain-containing protein [Moritella sp. Urea-trap-13]